MAQFEYELKRQDKNESLFIPPINSTNETTSVVQNKNGTKQNDQKDVIELDMQTAWIVTAVIVVLIFLAGFALLRYLTRRFDYEKEQIMHNIHQ